MTDQESIRQAARVIQDGDRETGRRLLLSIVRANPRNAQAWLLMSGIADSEEEQRDCLLHVVEIEPNNSAAQLELAWLDMHLQGAASRTDVTESISPVTSHRLGPTSGANDLPESARTKGFRNTMLAGVMVLTLVCGLALLIVTVIRIVPEAQALRRPTPEAVLYPATLWCPACEQENTVITLWERVGDGTSRGSKVGELKHNTPVSVLAEGWSEAERRSYLKVSAQGQKGWVSAELVRRQIPLSSDSP